MPTSNNDKEFKNVNQEIVVMKFDNKNFEKNIKRTQKSIAELQKSLDFSGQTKNLDEYNKKLKKTDIGPIQNGLKDVGRGFDALKIAAISALDNIVDKAMASGAQIVNAMTISTPDMIKKGYTAYENEISATQTILTNYYKEGETAVETTKRVQKEIDRLYSVAEEMGSDPLKLLNLVSSISGAGLDIADAVDTAIGSALMGSLGGKSATSQAFDSLMYYMAQGINSGKLGGNALRSLKEQGIFTKEVSDAIIAAALSQTEVVEGIETTLLREVSFVGENGKIINGYYKTSAANYSDIETMYHEMEEAYKISEQEGDKIRQEFEKIFVKKGDISGIELTADELKRVTTNLSKEAQVYFEYAEKYDVSLSEAVKSVNAEYEALGKTLTKGMKAFSEVFKTKSFTEMIDYLKLVEKNGWKNIIKSILGDYEDAVKLWSGLTDLLYEPRAAKIEQKQNLIETWMGLDERAAANKIEEIKEQLLKSFRQTGNYKTDEELEAAVNNYMAENSLFDVKVLAGGRETIIESIKMIISFIQTVKDTAKSAWQEIFPPKTAERFGSITQKIHGFIENITTTFNENSDKFSSFIKGFATLFKGIKDVFKSLYTEIIKPIFDALFGKSKEVEDASNSSFMNALETIGNFLSKIGNWLSTEQPIKKVVDWVNDLWNSLFGIDFFQSLKSIFDVVKDIFKDIGGFISAIFKGDSAVDAIKNITEPLDGASKDLTTLEKILNTIRTILGTVLKAIGSIADKFSGIKSSGKKAGDAVSEMVEGIAGATNKEFNMFNEESGLLSVVTRTAAGFNTISTASETLEKGLGKTSAAMHGINEEIEDTVEESSPLEMFINGLANLIDSLSVVVNTILASFGTIFNWLSRFITILFGTTEEAEKIAPKWVKTLYTIIAVVGVVVVLIATLLKRIEFLAYSLKPFGSALDDLAESKRIEATGRRFKDLGIAFALLAAGLAILGNLEWEELLKGLVGVGLTLGMLIGAVALLNKIMMRSTTEKGLALFNPQDQNGPFGKLLGMYNNSSMKNWKTLTWSILKISASVFIITLALRKMANIIIDLKDIDFWKQISTVTAMGIFLAGLAVLGRAMGRYAKDIKSGLKLAPFLLLMMPILWILSRFIIEVSAISSDKVLAAVGSLTALLVGLTAIPLVLGKFDKYAGQALAAIPSIMALTLVCVILAALVYLLKDIPFSQAIGSVGALLIFLTGISAIIVLLGIPALAAFYPISLLAIPSIIALTIVCALLAGIVWLLKDIPFDQAIGSVGALLIFLTGLIVMLPILSLALLLLALPIGILAGLLVSVGSVIKNIDVGELALFFTAELIPLVEAIGAAFIVMKAFDMYDVLESVVGLTLIMLPVSVLAGLMAYVGNRIKNVDVGKLALFFTTALIPLVEAIGAAFIMEKINMNNVLESIIGLTSIMLPLSVLAGLMVYVGNKINNVDVGKLALFFTTALIPLAEIVGVLYAVKKLDIDNIFSTMFELAISMLPLSFIVGTIIKLTSRLFSNLPSWSKNFSKTIKNIVPSALSIIDLLKSATDLDVSKIKDFSGVLVSFAYGLLTFGAIGLVGAPGILAITGALALLVNTVGNALSIAEESENFINGLTNAFATGYKKLTDDYDKFKDEGFFGFINDIFDGTFAEKIKAKGQEAINAVKRLFGLPVEPEVSDEYDPTPKPFDNTAYNKLSGVTVPNLSTLYDDWTGLTTEQVKTMNNVAHDFETYGAQTGVSIGRDWIMGLIKGMLDSGEFGSFEEALKFIATHPEAVLRKYTDTHSPSEVFAEIGRDWVDGLIEGIQDSESELRNALVAVAASAMDEFANAFASQAIRPVVDLGETSTYGYMPNSIASKYLSNNLRSAQNISDYASENGGRGLIMDNRQITNNFTITGDNPREIAEEVAKILQDDVNGRDRVWA